MNKGDKILNILIFLLPTLFLLSLFSIPFGLIPFLDDFCQATPLTSSFLEEYIRIYKNWQGRYISNFLMFSVPLKHSEVHSIWISSILNLCIVFVSSFLLFRSRLKVLDYKYFPIILFGVFISFGNFYSSFFFNAYFYTYGMSFLVIFALVCTESFKARIFLLLILAGLSEVVSFSVLIAFFLHTLVTKERKNFLYCITLVVGLLVSVYFSGTMLQISERSNLSSNLDFLSTIKLFFINFTYIISSMSFWSIPLTLLLGSLVRRSYKGNRELLFVFLVFLGGVFGESLIRTERFHDGVLGLYGPLLFLILFLLGTNLSLPSRVNISFRKVTLLTCFILIITENDYINLHFFNIKRGNYFSAMSTSVKAFESLRSSGELRVKRSRLPIGSTFRENLDSVPNKECMSRFYKKSTTVRYF